jgi:hypothetical protein
VAKRVLITLGATLAACAPVGPRPAPAPADSAAVRDSVASPVPPGFGTLRQDDIALRVTRFGLQVRAMPLDESIIRVLSPDSYTALRDIVASQRVRIQEVSQRTGVQRLSLWYVSFFGLEQGETRYSPMEFLVSNVGRDFRPLEIIPLSPGFGRERLRQREAQNALYVFDGQLDVNQPLSISFETTRNADWWIVLARIERERALVRSRAAARPGGF